MISLSTQKSKLQMVNSAAGNLDYVVHFQQSEPDPGALGRMDYEGGNITTAATTDLIGPVTDGIRFRSITEMYIKNKGATQTVMFQMADASDTWEMTPKFSIGYNESLVYQNGKFSIMSSNVTSTETFREFQIRMFQSISIPAYNILTELKLLNANIGEGFNSSITYNDLEETE